MIIYAVLVPLTFQSLSQLKIPFFPSESEIFGFPTVWNYLTWTASWWNILLGVLIVILVCNDINYKTQRQNIIDGLSRKDIILGKLYFLIALAFVIAVYTFLIGAVVGSIYSSPENMFNGIEYVGIYFIQTLGYFSFAFFFAVLVRKPALSIVLFVVIIMLDAILYWPLSEEIAQFFPTITISELTPFPFFRQLLDMQVSENPDFEAPYVLSQSVRSIMAVIYIGIFTFIGYISLKKRDL